MRGLVRWVAAAAGLGTLLLTRSCITQGDPPPPRGDEGQGGEVAVSDLGFFLGDPSAPLQIVEFTDPSCPYCADFHQAARAELFDEFVVTGRARWVTIPWESDQYANSMPAVIAVECAPDPATAERVTEALYADRDRWVGAPSSAAEAVIREAAAGAGIEGAALDRCETDQDLLARIDAADSLATALGVRGTPTYLIDGFPMMGAVPFSFARRAFDARLAELAADSVG